MYKLFFCYWRFFFKSVTSVFVLFDFFKFTYCIFCGFYSIFYNFVLFYFSSCNLYCYDLCSFLIYLCFVFIFFIRSNKTSILLSLTICFFCGNLTVFLLFFLNMPLLSDFFYLVRRIVVTIFYFNFLWQIWFNARLLVKLSFYFIVNFKIVHGL